MERRKGAKNKEERKEGDLLRMRKVKRVKRENMVRKKERRGSKENERDSKGKGP